MAVHENGHGDVVIRQERDDRWGVPVQDAERIAQAIIEKVHEIEARLAGDEQPAETATSCAGRAEGCGIGRALEVSTGRDSG